SKTFAIRFSVHRFLLPGFSWRNFGDVESDGGERTTKLLAKIAIASPNLENDRTQIGNGGNRKIEDEKGRFCFHARPRAKEP
ncbi:MAG: hypothetical protein ACRELY_00685, partial [Polyangiaceae bacterium]